MVGCIVITLKEKPNEYEKKSIKKVNEKLIEKSLIDNMKKSQSMFKRLIIALLVSIIIFVIRNYIEWKTAINIFDSIVFFVGLSGLRFFIRELIELHVFGMMPAQGGGQGNPNPGNPNTVNTAANPVIPTVIDPTGVGRLPFLDANGNKRATYRPYSLSLAAKLDAIKTLNGGKASPPFNNHLDPAEKA
jgi:hypothetical protein